MQARPNTTPDMPESPEEEETVVIHEGSLMQQKDGKFAKRWVVLHKGKTTGYIYMKIYRHPREGTTISNFETPKSHFGLTEDEFIGTVKGKIESSRGVFHYWSIILQSEIIKFQEKSIHVCDNWNQIIRDNIEYIVLEVLTISGEGIKHNPKTLLHLTDNLLALSYSDLSKVFRSFKLKNVYDVFSSGCIVGFTVNDEEKHAGRYEIETMRDSKATRIVEDILYRQRKLRTSAAPSCDRLQIRQRRYRKESFQEFPLTNVAVVSVLESFKNEQPILTPPSSPGSSSPNTMSPHTSPDVSPALSKRKQIDHFSSLPSGSSIPAILRGERKLSLQGESVSHSWKRKNAVRRRKSDLNSPVWEEISDSPPIVPERPCWTINEDTVPQQLLGEHNKMLNNYNVPRSTGSRNKLVTMTSVECAICVHECICDGAKGPVLPKRMKSVYQPTNFSSETVSRPYLKRTKSREELDIYYSTSPTLNSPVSPSSNKVNTSATKPTIPTRSRSVTRLKDELDNDRKPVPARRSGLANCQRPVTCHDVSLETNLTTNYHERLLVEESAIEGASEIEEDPYMTMFGWASSPYVTPSTGLEEMDNDNTCVFSNDTQIPALRGSRISAEFNNNLPTVVMDDLQLGPLRNDQNSAHSRLHATQFTKSFDDIYELSMDMDEKDRIEIRGHTSFYMNGSYGYQKYANLNDRRRVNVSRNVSHVHEIHEDSDDKTLIQFLFEFITKKQVTVNMLGMKRNVWTYFLTSFDYEEAESNLKGWSGLAELMNWSESEIRIVEEQCHKVKCFASEFVMLYWSQCHNNFLPYTKRDLLDVLTNLQRFDLIEIIKYQLRN